QNDPTRDRVHQTLQLQLPAVVRKLESRRRGVRFEYWAGMSWDLMGEKQGLLYNQCDILMMGQSL
ncbi:MAG: hypothetical protein R6U51_08205, partial [Anaerolineales bacterium]